MQLTNANLQESYSVALANRGRVTLCLAAIAAVTHRLR
jgi:hypothetical protein